MAVGIAAGTRVGGGTDYDPMRMLNEALTLRNTQAGFMARNKAGSIISQYPDDPAAAAQALQSDPMVSGFYPEAINIQRQLQLMQAETGLQQARTRGEIAGQGRDAYADVMGAGLTAYNDPTQLLSGIMGRLSRYPVSLQEQLKPSIEIWTDSLTHGLNLDPSNPKYADSLRTYQARMAGQLIATGHTKELYSLMGVPEPGFTRVPVPGSTQEAVIPTGGLPPWMTDPRVIAGQGATGTGQPVSAQPLPVAGSGQPPVSDGVARDNQLAIPPPPQSVAGYGSPLMGIPWTTTQTKQWSDLEERQTALNDQIESGNTLMQNVNEATRLLGKLNTGALTPLRSDMANLAIGLNADPATVKAIQGGSDVAAAQEFNKLMFSQVMNQVNQQLPPGSRLNLKEFEAATLANPSLTMQRTAIENIFRLWQRTYVRNRMQQKFLADYIGRNPRSGAAAGQWDPYWNDLIQRKGLTGSYFKSNKDPSQAIDPADVMQLLAHDTPATRKSFDSHYGSNAAERFLDEDAE